MMPKRGTSKSTSGKEDGDIRKHSLNEARLSVVAPDPQNGNGCGINRTLSEYVTQGQNDTAGNMEVASAKRMNDKKQIFSNGRLAQKGGSSSLVIKELGITSTDFIGPACRPQQPKPKAEPKPKAKPRPKAKPEPTADIENELSDFYKELEELGPEDCVDGNTDEKTDKNNTESREPENPPLCGLERFPKDRDSRGPHPYRPDNSDHWHPKRPRTNFQQGPNWHGPDQPYYMDQWNNFQAFRGPNCPPYHSLNRFGNHGPPGPPGPPPPPHPPPGPLYPTHFGPRMSTYYGRPETGNRCQWEDRQFPPGPGYPPLDGFGGYGAPRDCSNPAYPPDGFNGCRDDGGNGSDRNQRHKPEPEPEPGPQKQYDQLPHSDCDYRPKRLLVLILMRGLPGSGKSTLAKKLLSSGTNGLVLSTDDYFAEDKGYAYSPSLIGNAHDWNQNRAREAMDGGRSPVIIDNTNIQAWEMKPYVKMALDRGYNIDFQEPDTSWRLDPFELEKRNKHNVPSKKIAQMLERFELPMSVDVVLNSRDPPHKSAEWPPSQRPPR